MKRLAYLTGWVLGIAAVVVGSGCGAPEAEFQLNTVYVRASDAVESNRDFSKPHVQQQMKQLADVMAAVMGTPDNPHIPVLEDVDLSGILDMDKLQMAAGPVSSDELGRARGLYREHCVHCHGISGDGMGPTAPFLNPYPRDYRRGLYKFKSTPSNIPPSNDDLHRILIEGVAGTAMPSFRLLTEDERESLVQYVRYLSIRGEVERSLIFFMSTEGYFEEDSDYTLMDLSLRSSDPEEFQLQLDTIKEAIAPVVERWTEANSAATEVPAPPENWNSVESVDRGRELFFSTLANCFSCHGNSALGDGVLNDYDEWTKELTPKDPERLNELLSLGALKPRNIRPRNLREGIYRGGRRPIDMFWRLKNGITGTTMPAVSRDLSDDDLWHIIAYVRQLPFESISRPGQAETFQRERM